MTITYQRELSAAEPVDVLVIGGGPAGLAAAVGSARTGARTRLVERYGFLGGNLTAGLVGPAMTSYSLDGRQQLIKGVFEEFVRRMEAVGGALHPSGIQAGSAYSGFIVHGHDKVTPFEPEAAKSAALEMCLDAGIDIALHTFAVDALTSQNRLTGVVCASKSGLSVESGTVVVDCSADADVASAAGVPVQIGRNEDGLTQPMTLFFRLADIDDAVVERYVAEHPQDFRPFSSIVAQARERGEFPSPRLGVGLYRTLRPGVWRINTTRVQRLVGSNAHDLTSAEIEGRRQVTALVEFFRKRLPGFENCTLLDTAAQIGVRETRRIEGEYCLTLDDLASGREFDDVIALCGYPVDLHSPTGAGGGLRDDLHTADTYHIPFRSLVPARVEQLLVAGRCVSATHEALAAIRVMPPSFAMGHAAGVAAALSVDAGCSPRELPVSQVQRELLAQGAYLGAKAATLTEAGMAPGDGRPAAGEGRPDTKEQT